MSQQNHDIGKLTPLEAEMVRNLRQIALREREDLVATSASFVELFPLRPTLRLVQSVR